MDRRRSISFPVLALLAAFGGWTLRGLPAWGAHFDNTVSDLASFCYDCHTLNANLADDNTSFIQAASRTLPTMRSINAGVAPITFGCTYCHNDPTRTGNMKTAVGPFDQKSSQHPVDRAFNKDANSNVTLNSNTYSTLYMSNWDNSFALPASQIGCVDCHDADANGGSYPNHPVPGIGSRAAAVNPFMLKNTTAMDNGHAPNSFCLETCHSGAAPGTSGWKMGHYGWGAFDNAGTLATLKEHDGTALKTSKCVDCHETHSSNAKPNLMGEQRQSILNVDTADCTAQCHSNASFLAAGHGKTGINQTCGNCHTSAVSHRDSGNPKRFNGSWDTNMASLMQNLAANGIDDDFNGLIDDGGEANFQYSQESNCSASCHGDKHVHQGVIGAVSGSASCLHCHDPHGKGVDNNARMIRRTVMGKETLYWSTADLFRADNTATRASICDNPSCHAKPLGDTGTPGTIMYDVPDHRDAGVGIGYDCTSCHNHSSTSGGSSFAAVCNACHTYPGQAVLSGTHVLSAVHTKHAAQDTVGGYAFDCGTCHYKYTHNQSGVNNAGEWTSKFQSGNVNIKFDGTWNAPNANGPKYGLAGSEVPADNTLADNVYAPGVGGTGRCVGLYCHGNSANVSSWPAGTNVQPTWDNVGAPAACGTCHRATASVPPQTFAHTKHTDNTTIGYAISCKKCHYQTSNDGLTITDRSAHLNRQSQISFDATDPLVFSGSYSGTTTVGDSGSTTGQCSNIYCHSPGNRSGAPFDNGALGLPDWKQAGPLACNACHGAAGQTGIAVGMPAYPNGTPKINSHDKHLRDRFACQVCHWQTTTTGSSIANRGVHVNGAYEAVNDNLARHAFTYAASTCSAAVCHGGLTSGPNLATWGGGPYGCDVCHMNTGGAASTADVDQYAYDNGMAKINADQWNGAVNGSGHGKTGTFASGNPGTGTTFSASCSNYCHTTTTQAGHDNSVNPFRLRTAGGVLDFSDAGTDPANQQNENRVCLDCHSSAGTNSTLATRHVEENHYGLKHNDDTEGGTFCFDCHDPHGDANHYMIHDNVTRVSDGVYGIPTSVGRVTFDNTNLNGESYNSVKDWGDYVDNSGPTPYTGVCQACHTDPAGTSGGTTGGAAYFSSTRFQADHNKQAGVQGDRCTNCHTHNADFTPSCNACHGYSGSGSGAPPDSPKSGSLVWSSSVDRIGTATGQGLHRVNPADNAMRTDHDGLFACSTCHTNTPGSGTDHNQATNVNATMTNLVARKWTDNVTATTWTPRTDGATGGVVDDSCNNVNCHSPYGPYQSTNPSGTPFAYERYWENYTRWDCYTCHGYKDAADATNNPGSLDRRISTGSHSRHIRTAANGGMNFDCSMCHETGNATKYSATSPGSDNTFPGTHRSGFVDWNFAGAGNPYGSTPSYSVASGTAAPTDNNTGAGHRAYGSCANLYCHGIGQTSTGDALTGAAGEYKSPKWDNTFGGRCGDCHAGDGVTDNTASVIASGSHTKHAGSAGSLNYPCSTCHNSLGRGAAAHVDNAVNLSFSTVGAVSLASTVYSQGLDNIVGNGYGNCTAVYCHGTGTPALTGGSNRATGTTNVPAWGAPGTALCGSCHGAPNGTTNYPPGTYVGTQDWPSSGAHARHLSDAFGPKIASCTDCHTAQSVSTHGDGKVDFRTRFDNTAATTKALTQTCDPCHGTGVAQAKRNWDNVAALDCLTCHGPTAAYTFANATGRVAPNMAGDNTTYGSNVRGHNRPPASGPYPVTGNPAANRTCDSCHDLAISHIDGTDNTAYAGNRLLATVNGSATGSTVRGLCEACHRTAGASSATKKSINTHGSTNYAARLEPATFELSCNQCHEPHGMVNVTAAPAGVNIWMINPTIQVTTGASPITVSPVRLFAKSGANSFNVYDPGAGNDNSAALYNTNASGELCVSCHANPGNPGYQTRYNVAGRHNAPGYSGNEAGKDCSGCHSHNQDGNIATVDGLMPLACNACHSYPGVAGGTYTKEMSAVHAKHVGTPADTTNSRQYECTVCHFDYSHNQNGVVAGGAWPGTYYTFVDIHFDNTINPSNANGPKYNNVSTPTTGNGGTGACAGIYCHGNSASQSTWGGTTTATPPKWDNTVTASCGTCHRADATMPQGNHPAHLSAAYGPGSAAFTASGSCSEGTGCHTAYGFSPATSHANGQPSFRTSTADNTPVGLGATQICRNCHTTYTSADIPISGDVLVRTSANWDNGTYKVACLTCHNNGTQGTQALDGSGDKAPNIEAAYSSNGHGASSIDNGSTTTDAGDVDQVPPVRCGTCHDELGAHIGTAKDGTNPWRLDDALTNYTQSGGLDRFCLTQCHSQTALPPRHARIVNGTWGVSKDNSVHTHPTAMQVVPQPGAPSGETVDKSRWFQVPTDTAMPVAADLTTKTPPARSNGTLLVCATCHDPHGVDTALVAQRTFSGANDNGYKMLRYKASGVVPTPLCSKCHQ